ncbi:hypothetical protein CFC21_086094 [Triticum aestivum]|uniref:Uncharacterized protein n=2 Tax=Triticum aestivum TaxID=4565 RepID=A0A9R1IDK8_WHEAT|nr:hypothetical protein CFC21_086094 [Triticum aestivum]
MAIGVDRGTRAPAPTSVDDATTEADFVCALRKCVLLLAYFTAMGSCPSLLAELGKDGVRGIVGTAHGVVFICCNSIALVVSGFILLRLNSKVLGTRGMRYYDLQVIIILDVLGLIGAYSAASLKTAILLVSLVVVVLLYVASQVLLFLSKPVGRLLPHVEEAPPPKCLKFQKRVRRQQTMVVSTQGKVEDAAAFKCLFLSIALATSMACDVRVGPTPLAASGDLDTGIVLPKVTELVYFHWNDTASVASLMFIHLYFLSRSFSKQKILYRALQVTMTLDLFAFVAVSASRNWLRLPAFVYISVLAPVSLYAGIMAMVSMSEMFPTCNTWGIVLREKMEQYCVPNWLTKSFELPTDGDGHTEDTRQTTGWNLEDYRQSVLFVAIGMANGIKNQASMSLSQLGSRPVLVVDSRAFHLNEFYVRNLTDQSGISSLSSLWQENTSGSVNLNLAFYCYATAFTGFLAIIVLLANEKIWSEGIQYYVMRLCMVLQLLSCVVAMTDVNLPKKSMVDVFRDASILLVTMIILSRGPRKTVQSILRWLQHTLQEDPSEGGSKDELEFGLADGGTNREPVAVEISAPILGGALTLVLAIPVMRMLASPVKMVLTFFFGLIGANLCPRLLARLLQVLARALYHRHNPGQGSTPTAFNATSLARRGWYIVLAMCNGLCKVIRALCSKGCVWILVLVIWFPSLMSNLKLKVKISSISALVCMLIALATTATTVDFPTTETTTITMESSTTETTATGMRTSTTAMTTSGTNTRSNNHPPRVEPRPRRSCRPNTRLIGEEWVK